MEYSLLVLILIYLQFEVAAKQENNQLNGRATIPGLNSEKLVVMMCRHCQAVRNQTCVDIYCFGRFSDASSVGGDWLKSGHIIAIMCQYCHVMKNQICIDKYCFGRSLATPNAGGGTPKAGGGTPKAGGGGAPNGGFGGLNSGHTVAKMCQFCHEIQHQACKDKFCFGR